MPAVFNDIVRALEGRTPAVLHDAEGHRACVLVPLVLCGGEAHLLLTKRTDRVEHHKGQISFPGGMVDDGDASARHTALRELEEEVGIPATAVRIAGQLDDIHIPSGFVVTPVVGLIEHLPEPRVNPDEVAEVLLIPFAKFFDPALRRTEWRDLKGMRRQVYLYDVWREPVWGATAHIIKQFTDLLARTIG